MKLSNHKLSMKIFSSESRKAYAAEICPRGKLLTPSDLEEVFSIHNKIQSLSQKILFIELNS